MPDDPSDLRERVRELEQTVSEQQQTIQKLMPSRRAVLSGLVGAGAGAAGVYAGTDRASAQAAGQVGTSSNPVDAFAYNLDVQNGADLNGTDLTNVGAADIGDVSIGATDDQYELPAPDDTTVVVSSFGGVLQYAVQKTPSVAQTSTPILQTTSTGVHFVGGVDGSGNRFVDRVTNAGNDQSNIELHTLNSPAARSYNMNIGELTLSMASDSYDIRTHSLQMIF